MPALSACLSLLTAWRPVLFLLLMGGLFVLMLYLDRKRRPEAAGRWHGPQPHVRAQSRPSDDGACMAAAEAVYQRHWAIASNFLRAASTEGLNPTLAFLWGVLYHEHAHPMEAEAYYRAALELEPGHRDAAFNLGVLLAEQERFPEAIAAYRLALSGNQADADVLYNLGHVYFHLRMYPQAQAEWQRAARLAPDAREVRDNLRFLARLTKAEEVRRQMA
jgi:tetratricopeptide (TPR) repeat protein